MLATVALQPSAPASALLGTKNIYVRRNSSFKMATVKIRMSSPRPYPIVKVRGHCHVGSARVAWHGWLSCGSDRWFHPGVEQIGVPCPLEMLQERKVYVIFGKSSPWAEQSSFLMIKKIIAKAFELSLGGWEGCME